MTQIRSIEQAQVAGKRVLVRVDFNVPLKGDTVTDDTRIKAALPTIKYLRDKGACIILMSHLGRPSGKGFEPQYSLAPVAKHLSNLLSSEVIMCGEVIGPHATQTAEALSPGEMMLLENVRFEAGEKKNDSALATQLAQLADVYVNDAFGTAHRAHASTAGVAQHLPSYAGFLMQKEVSTLTGMLEMPQRPFVAILGGSKVSDKVGVIDALLEKADTVIIGGGMCFTFLATQGYEVGQSLVETDWIERARDMIHRAEQQGKQLLLPTDVVVADKFAPDTFHKTVPACEIPSDMMGLDIGPETQELYAEAIGKAKTVFWNGPMGVFEMDAFAAGTRAVACAMAHAQDAYTIIGGGDSVAAANKFNLADAMTFISTGGGASMELVQGEDLPGVAALSEK